jgi:hypothetical protein
MGLTLLYQNIPLNKIKDTMLVMCEYKDITKNAN